MLLITILKQKYDSEQQLII